MGHFPIDVFASITVTEAVGILDFLHNAAVAETEEHFEQLMNLIRKVFPFRSILIGVVNVDAFDPSNSLAWEVSPSNHCVINGGFPDQWVREYFHGSYFRYDKVVHLLMRGCLAHTWDELYTECETALERMVFDGARTHGIYPGFSAGYSESGSHYRSFISCSGYREGDDTRLLPIVQYLLSKIHCALVDVASKKMRMNTEFQEGPHLSVTSRAKEIATWVCEGKTYQEIALILGLKERTVRYHISRLFERFGVHNRSRLVKELLNSSWFNSNEN